MKTVTIGETKYRITPAGAKVLRCTDQTATPLATLVSDTGLRPGPTARAAGALIAPGLIREAKNGYIRTALGTKVAVHL